MWYFTGPIGQTIYFISKLYIFSFPLIWWLKVDRKSISFSPMNRGGLGVGIATGVVISLFIWLGYQWFGDQVIDPQKMRGLAAEAGFAKLRVYLVMVLMLSFGNALMEEYVWRWFVFTKSKVLWGTLAAAVVTGIFFSVHHAFALYPQFGWPLTLIGSLGTFIGSLVWSWCYHRYGSLWPAYASHVVIDLMVFFIGYQILFG